MSEALQVPNDPGSPTWKRLITCPPTTHEWISLTTTILSNHDEIEAVSNLCGDDAQSFIDIMDEVLDSLTPHLRRKCLNILCKICGHQSLLPRSLQIPLCHDQSDPALYSGGYADVWKGQHQGYSVAVKVLRVYSTSDFHKIQSRFCREAIMWKTLHHPNVLPLLGATMSNYKFAMTSKWMANGNINEFIEAHPGTDRFELLEGVVKGLIYLHDQAMVHGDLKGANILINQHGHACLADFGLLVMVSDNTNPTFSNSLTIAGTIRWMSPELLDPDQFGLKGTLPTRKSDCYALGMVIYEALSGNVPFAAYGVVSVIQKITIGGRPERPQGTEGAWFVDRLWDTLRLCWAHQPDGRPAIQDVLECLERVSRTLKSPSSTDDNADDQPLTDADPVARPSPPLAGIETEEPPTGVLVPCCVDGQPCHTSSCPRRGQYTLVLSIPAVEALALKASEWQEGVPPEILASLPESEIKRQTFIHYIISTEQQYIKDLNFIEDVFIRPLRDANPPVIQDGVHEFIDEVFGNILDLRECNQNLLEAMHVRQREQGEVISRVGDIFLNAATEFRLAYPTYMGRLPGAERRLKGDMETNCDLRVLFEQCARHPDNVRKIGLEYWLYRPLEYLQKYPAIFEAIRTETAEGSPDVDFLKEAIEVMRNLQSTAQLRIFQTAMGEGPTGKFGWHSLVPEDVRNGIPEQASKRQAAIFDLIKGEMDYVKDLENIELVYVQPLRSADPPIIPRERLDRFIRDVFHNISELHTHHKRLLDRLFEVQREEHPIIKSVTAAMHDAVLNFRGAYLDYIPNCPIAEYRIDDEIPNNPQFRTFVDQCVRHPGAQWLDIKNFINKPISRLLRYESLLKFILEGTPAGHDDLDTIPAVLDVIKGLGKETEPGVVSAKQKVELWRYNANLVFKVGENIDMDLLNENRSLIHTGRFLRPPDTGFGWSGWTELVVLLFDDYLFVTKPKGKHGITKYQVYRRPIPLDLLTLVTFTDPPTQRGGRLLPFGGNKKVTEGPNPAVSPPGVGASPDAVNDARAVYPCTIRHDDRLGGLFTLYAESSQARLEWKAKLEEAIGLRAAQESNKVFEMGTFFDPTLVANADPSSNDGNLTEKVTCSIPFTTPDGREMVAIGCAEGVWIGHKYDTQSMQRVLHLRMVTQCAVLENFGIFLVLADKSLFAYYIEALVPSSPGAANAPETPQRLSWSKDVEFFTVGNLGGRTLVICVKKLDSVFQVLEPVIENIIEGWAFTFSFESRFGLRCRFRVHRVFSLPLESHDVLFLETGIAIMFNKGFEIMHPADFKSVTIPRKKYPRLVKLSKRWESCRPVGMFRSNEDEFLLCYDEFGLYVDKHGDPSNIGTVEWEGRAERVAWHPPYILLFDSRFIEIRHVKTGRLVQIIPGNDMQCVWDDRSTNHSRADSEGSRDEIISQEPRVHGVMNMGAPQHDRRGVITQRVFELIPSFPLPLHGSSAPPSHASYLNHDVKCDSCSQMIIGTRYQCGNCPSIPHPYNLCKPCDDKSYMVHDPTHIFFKLRRPVDRRIESSEPILPALYKCHAASTSTSDDHDPKAYPRNATHVDVLCDLCMYQIRGQWFHCVYCPRDLCDQCEEVDHEHDTTHFSMVAKSPVDMTRFYDLTGLDTKNTSGLPIMKYAVYYS